ncbi:uncharacterized protein F4822DRAFT_409469 [Hypoxylon trugodes]|uniref:uncharacterized protein n=1 Tax=Hypoxylon trugodes TaxID=326681 RepID=UPI002194B234|nr:uncharacterized protein F4822DRAFT_409469 [Hypoxylon trugodes]KAI1386257.1 hypothetical protein F4822DRAFT_409469 [Hypoxylon trugodes]
MFVVPTTNLIIGITHGDIKLRRILFDDVPDNMVLCGFDYSSRISRLGIINDMRMLVWAMYELVTQDVWLRGGRRIAPDTHLITSKEDWEIAGTLMCNVGFLRRFLQDWINRRNEDLDAQPTNPVDIDWDPLNPPLDPAMVRSPISGAVKVNWERPA